MSDTENKTEEEKGWIKAKLHERLVASLSFAEVVQIINNMLIKEVDDRLDNMSEEELESAYAEFGTPANQEDKPKEGSEPQLEESAS